MQNAINVLVFAVSVLKKGGRLVRLLSKETRKKSEETEKRAKKKSLDSFFSLSHFVTVWTVDDV